MTQWVVLFSGGTATSAYVVQRCGDAHHCTARYSMGINGAMLLSVAQAIASRMPAVSRHLADRQPAC